MKRKKLKRGIAALLSVILVAGSLAVMPDNKTVVQAAGGESTAKAIAGLGTDIIADPTVSISSSYKWKGSYVYFGNYNDTPVKYRVLDSNTTVFGGTTMLLDCNSILWAGDNPSSAYDNSSKVWADSDIRKYLNRTFLTGNFTTAEQNAIAESFKSSVDGTDGNGYYYCEYISLVGDKIFFLDAKEATNTSYGYGSEPEDVASREKTGGNDWWWLRSSNINHSDYAVIVDEEGQFQDTIVDFTGIGVSPALNVDLSSVLFSSVISGTAGETGAEYKLTLIDENLTIEKNGAIKREEDTVTIQCIIRGTNNSRPTQASVFLLDKEYTEGNTNDAKVLYYGALDRYGSFTLPEALSDKVCGRDYYAYIIAEDINGVAETDYASEPVKIFIPWSVKSKNLGTSGIVDPIVPASNSDAWTGSYVYFGTYDTDGDGTPEPVKYRILDSNTTVFGGKNMLLDCNSILETRPFDEDSNVWADSDIRTYLNGTFLTGNFTTAEQNAIASSTKNAADSTDGDGWIELNFATLSGDKIFLLDAKEATNTSYGYGNTNNGSESIKKGNSAYWWLRSASSYSVEYVGIIHHAGSIIDGEVNDTIVSVSPALNVNLASVLFSSIVNGTGSYVGPEYKLTLIDENLTVAIDGTVIRSGDRIMVPYTIGGTNSANATQVSVLLLDKEYTEGNTNDAEVLYYGALNSNDSFTLPEALSDKVCGIDYYAYIIAEDINGVAETDYASEPVELTEIYDGIDNVAVELDAPESSEALDTEVSILTSGIAGATVTWKEGETTVTGNADYSTVYTAYITVSKNENLLWTPTVTATVNGQQASVVRQDGSTVTLTYTFAVTDKERLISITNPQSITVANGTSYEEMNLPEKVYITTEGNTYSEADVEWDTTNPVSGSYDPDILTEQTVVLKGTVTCPEGIDSNNVSLTTTITITISAEETEPEETEPEDKEPEETEPEDKEPEDKEPEDKESEYEITDGNDSEWTADSDEGITITGSGDDEDFVGIRINGEFIDSSNYTIEENGAVTLKKEYLDTLPADTYTIDMVWNDGEASTEITINKSSVTGSPDAGDGGNVHLWILFVIGLGLVGVVIISRRKSVID